jgi:hypothetical protein
MGLSDSEEGTTDEGQRHPAPVSVLPFFTVEIPTALIDLSKR